MNNHLDDDRPVFPDQICLLCNKQLRGRVDKKYCNEYCRGAYHNARRIANPLIRDTLSALTKNRRILQEMLSEASHQKISRDTLLSRGFQFGLITQVSITNGEQFNCCFEFQYREIRGRQVFISQRPKRDILNL